MIARIERVPLREVWPNEAYDFTPWLEKNIDILGEELDIELSVVEREKHTPESGFSADLVVSDEDENTIVIENQLEKSNHDHLGKLITYLAVMQAHAAVWIVSGARPEHIAAVNRLNESGDADYYLFKLEVVRIGNSESAPLLTRIVGPSEELRSIGYSKKEMSAADHERRQKRIEWWSQLIRHPDAKKHSHLTPTAGTKLRTSAGKRGISFVYGARKADSDVDVTINRGTDKKKETLAIFDKLHEKKDQIEDAFGSNLKWGREDEETGSWVGITLQGGYDDPRDTWGETHDKITDAMNRLMQAVRPHLDKINS